MRRLLEALATDPDLITVTDGIRSGLKEQLVSGLTGSARSVFVAALHSQLQRPIVVMTHNMFSAQKLIEDLEECLPRGELLAYPANESIATEAAVSSPELVSQRIDALSRLANGFRGVLVVPYAGVRRLVAPKETFQGAAVTASVGETLAIDALLGRLAELGYERVERVEGRGEMSVRGGIVDVYPLKPIEGSGGEAGDLAVRIEWFDDEIDSIRLFDPVDQRSKERLERVTLLPSRELFAEPRRFENAARTAAELLDRQLERTTDRTAKEKLREEIGGDLVKLREGAYFTGIYKYVSLLYPERQTLLDYLPKDALLLVDEPNRLLETAKQLDRDEAEWTTHLLQEGKTIPSFALSKSYESLFFHKPLQTVYLSLFLRQIPNTQPQNIVNVICRAMQQFHGQMNVLKTEIERWSKSKSTVMMLAGSKERLDRMRRVLADYGIPEQTMIEGNLQSGFELPSVHLVVITEGEMFSAKQRKARKVERKIENAERIKSYTELKIGDYVVHVNHGIGKYVGIGTIEIDGVHKDYLHILYAGGDKLSVPIEQIDMVQKYIGAEEGKEPKVYKLGGGDWTKAKSKARSAVKDIADELIKLYAARQAAPGHAFPKDTPYQQEFEAMFPYDETTDQLRAIEEIKGDMERPQPMDRLLCGDVGYGKTEVAIRAAFKAAMDGKQVAVLVPTTILAQQHYETFRERFGGFPFNIGVLSRFRSKKEQTETIKGVVSGAIDVVIGTHRILSQDVKFKDLGLLIIDEEQRFGVTHKEKLKKLRLNVDVLTLTATPIPRTLHMSMLGVRDLSVIETPPENRFPVQTYVVEHSGALVRDAIERELARGGQVYYLYNRVQGIQQMADTIHALVPDARVASAHGQMSEQELERTILDFLDGEFDVLVSTSIIETGVDIPNVNTLIVHDADKMGLSQLYQLRGRVGRSNRIAYAYFTYQRDKVLNEVAEKRLQAIKEFTELGSGFKIAMRDLAIRGAGNLLGGEQHGFIASVGFDLYSQMLAEEIEQRKAALDGGIEGAEPAERRSKPVNTQIELTLDAYLPGDYIYDSAQKIEIYKKVAGIRSFEEENELADELTDRFGDMPTPVQTLLAVARLKVYGAEYGIQSIAAKGDDLIFTFGPEQNERIDGQKLFALSNRFERKLKLVPGKQIVIQMNRKGLSMEDALLAAEKLLQQYREVLKDGAQRSTNVV
ncbi:transcription-repair coupling factor [Paenibacillus antri]|uniref:Transcription-repair-coupling factor n=1 Tax=Paenibacillus antri TaxID=2582848 RepID=A0A5R9G794_9BACL|nr:transcription-repair coupling factor [Paenibacillus antri]TLS48603.1 transcription-repair coupling factor [Paenibacillus antri]